jgi:lysophospholipase
MAESGPGGVAAQQAALRRERPEGGRIHSGVGVGGAPLRYGHWEARGEKKGTCLLLQGRREFIEKYFETIRDLTARGYEVDTFDWRGQGKSLRLLENRQKGHIVSFDDYLGDMEHFIRRVIGKDAGPLVCLAHSMGAHLALRHAHDHPRAFERMILIAPMVAINYRNTPDSVINSIVNTACRLGFSKSYAPFQHDFGSSTVTFEDNPLTSDPDRFADEAWFVNRDKLLAMGGVTYGWLRAAQRSIALTQAPGYAEAIRTRTFFALAGHETVVRNEAAKAFARRMPAAEIVTLGDARHEILRETDGIRAMAWRLADEFLAI